MASPELKWPDKDPDEELDYTVDFSKALGVADQIASASIAISPTSTPPLAVVGSPIIDAANRRVSVVLSGGLLDEDYEILVEAITSTTPNPLTIQQTVLLSVRKK